MKIFHGWRMVGAAAGIQFLHACLFMQAFGAYVAVLSEERGWSKTALSGGAALQSVESAILGPVLGWLVDRFGPKWMLRLGILCLGGGFMLLSQVQSLVGFYVAVIVLALGASFGGYFPLSVALVHWFERRRARALSLMNVGLALGGIALPLVAWSMATFGWRTTAMASGIFALAVGLPLTTVFKGTPQELGDTVDGLPRQSTAPDTPAAEEADVGPDFTVRQALRSGAFWWLATGHGAAMLVVSAVNVHAISHMNQGLGYSVTEAAFVITIMTVAHLGGLLLGSWIGDRFTKRHMAALCMLAHAAGLLSLTYATNQAMVFIFAVLHGGAWGLRGPLMQAMRADYFGKRSFGKILGISAAVIAVGQITGPVLAGVFVDWTGNYQLGFTVLAIGAGLGSMLFLRARPPQRVSQVAVQPQLTC